MSATYQFQTPLNDGFTFNKPRSIETRRSRANFVFFKYDRLPNPQDYEIVIPTLSDTVPGSRSYHYRIGPLRPNVELPDIHLDPNGHILVMPLNNPQLPTFWGFVHRSGTYHVNPEHPMINGKIKMNTHL